MISYYFKSLRSKTMRQVDEYRSGAWVLVERPTTEEIAELSRRFSLDLGNLEDAVDEDEMPRLVRDGGLSYVYTRHVLKSGENDPSTSPALFIVGPDLFVTISLRPLPNLNKFLTNTIDVATTQRTKLLLLLVQELVDEYDVSINRLSRKIQRIRNRLRYHRVESDDFIDFVVVEDELNEYLSALQPLSTILRRLATGKYLALFEEDKDLVEDLLLDNEQSIEACKSTTKTIVNIREAYSTIASNELNRTMKILTIATVIIALPNVFFGMYGMNVDLPFDDNPYSYFFVVGMTSVVTLVTILVARRKHIF